MVAGRVDRLDSPPPFAQSGGVLRRLLPIDHLAAPGIPFERVSDPGHEETRVRRRILRIGDPAADVQPLGIFAELVGPRLAGKERPQRAARRPQPGRPPCRAVHLPFGERRIGEEAKHRTVGRVEDGERGCQRQGDTHLPRDKPAYGEQRQSQREGHVRQSEPVVVQPPRCPLAMPRCQAARSPFQSAPKRAPRR